MADDKGGGESPFEILWWFGGLLGALIFLWWWQGGAERADLRGIFLAPPPPIGSGDAYGPQFGTPTTTNEEEI